MQLKDSSLFRQQAYINGVWLDADGGQTIKVNNPATNEILGTVPKMGAAETRRAIEAADKALPAWRALTAKDRGNKLRRWFELMIENQDDLARLMTLEQGKPLAAPWSSNLLRKRRIPRWHWQSWPNVLASRRACSAW